MTMHRAALSCLFFAAAALLGACSGTPSHKPSEAECSAIAKNFAQVGDLPSEVEESFANSCLTAPKDKWKALHCVGQAKSREQLTACSPETAIDAPR
ncbi:MAG: hypothetical protein AAGA54_05270 [Myxococcota bacterium]